MAGLNFVGNAHYAKNTTGENEVAQYEFKSMKIQLAF